MKRFVTGVAGVCAVALLATAAFAQGSREGDNQAEGRRGPGGFRPPLLSALDANNDGELSTDEIDHAAKAVKSLDKNNDGKVTREELMPQGGPFTARGGEAGGEGRRSFDRDGADDRRGPGREGDAEGRRGPPNPEGFVERALRFDADKDGKLSKEELTKMAEQFGRGGRDGEERRPGAERRNSGSESPRSERPRTEAESK